MELWPNVSYSDAVSVTVGSIVRAAKQLAIKAVDPSDAPLLVVRPDKGFRIGAIDLSYVEVLVFGGTTILDLTGNDFAGALDRGRPNEENQGSIFVTEEGPMLAVAPEDEAHYLLLDPSNGSLQSVPNYPMPILKHWRLGVRGTGGDVLYLFKSE